MKLRKVTFSLVCVSLFTGCPNVTITHDALDLTWGIHSYWYWHLEAEKTGTVGKWAVRTTLECFFVTTHKRSCGKVMFSQASVCSRGGMSSHNAMSRPLPHHRWHLEAEKTGTVGKWAVRTTLECFLVTAHKRSCGKVMFSQASVCSRGGMSSHNAMSRPLPHHRWQTPHPQIIGGT